MAKSDDVYNPVQSVAPTTGMPSDTLSVRASGANFGGAVGEGLQQAGSKMEQGDNQLFNVLLQKQGMVNETLATDAETKTNIQYGDILNKYKSLEGLAAAAAHPQVVQDLATVRQKISADLPSDAARRAYNMLTARTEGYAIRDVGAYAATQLKAADTRSATDSLQTAVDSANDPVVATDPARFNDALSNVKFQANRIIVNQGYGDYAKQDPKTGDVTFDDSSEQGKQAKAVYQAYLDKALGSIYENQIKSVLTDPNSTDNVPKALDLFNREKDSIPSAAKAQISNMLYNPVRSYQTKGIADQAIGSAHNDYLSSIGDSAADRNLKNNNPGNMRLPGKKEFQSFSSMDAGVQAVGHQIGLYVGRGINTISQIVSTYAPASDNNNVAAYVSDVSKKTGIDPNVPITSSQINSVRDAMISHEQGGKSITRQTGFPQIHQSEADYLTDNYGHLVDNVRMDATERFGGDFGLVQSTVQHFEQQLNDKIRISKMSTKADGNLLYRAINGEFTQNHQLTSFTQLETSPNPDVRDSWLRYQRDNPTAVPNMQKILVANSRGPAVTFGNNFWKFYSAAASGQIDDPVKDLAPHLDSKELTNTGYNALTDIINRRSTPEGSALLDQEFKALGHLHDDATGAQFMGGLHSPVLEDNFSKQMQILLPQIDADLKSGKTAAQLFDPESKDYIGNRVKMPSMRQIQDEMTKSTLMHTGTVASIPAQEIKSKDDIAKMWKDGKIKDRQELMNLLVKHGFASSAPAVPGAHD